MKKAILAGLCIFTTTAFSSPWRLVDVLHPETADSVGFIYYTNAQATVDESGSMRRTAASLRLVCSTTSSDAAQALILVKDMNGQGTTEVTVSTLGQSVENMTWTQQSSIITKGLQDSKRMITLFSNSNLVSFKWKNNNTSYSVVFNTGDFKKEYQTFKQKCRLTE